MRVGLIAAGLLLAACAASPRTGAERLEYAERLSMDAEHALDRADAALAALQPEQAAPLIESAKQALADPDIVAYPDHQQLRDRASHSVDKLTEVRLEVERNETARRVGEARSKVEDAQQELAVTVAKLKDPRVSKAQLEAATKALEKVKEGLDVDDDRVKNDQEWADFARAVLGTLGGPRDEIGMVERIIKVEEGPLTDRREAQEHLARAKAEADLDDQLHLYGEAKKSFLACADRMKSALSETPKLAKRARVLAPDDRPQPFEAIGKSCGKEAASADKTIARLEKTKARKAAAEQKKNNKKKK